MPLRPFDGEGPDAVFAFLDDTVSARGRDHWRWKYRREAPAAFYWEDKDGHVLGFIGLMRTALHVGSQQHAAAWFVDWHVVPGERGVGVGLGLLRQAEAAAGILLTLQGSADTQQILPRLGWRESRAPGAWIRPLSARFVAEQAARRAPGWLQGAASVAGAAAAPYTRCRRPADRSDLSLVDVDRLPASYDAVWKQRAAEFGPAMSRTAAYLNFLCADFPDGGYRLQLLQRRGETAGHLVTRADIDRHSRRRGRIVDLLWPRAEAEVVDWLVHSACWQLQEGGADFVECLAAVPDLVAALHRRRFRSRGPVPVWYHRLPAGVPDPDQWYVTFLDCDRAYR